jgi:hypothetical protein
MSEVKAIDAAKAAVAEDAKANGLGKVKYNDVEYTVWKRPNALMLSEFSVSSDDPLSARFAYEVISHCLAQDFAKFRADFYAIDWDDVTDSFEALSEVLNQVLEVTSGRPKA